MMLHIKETTIETIFLLIFIGTMLWIGLADSWGHKIQHDFPYSYLASDTFQHQTRAQWIKDTGNYRYEAPYYSAGFTDVVGFYPPILHHITVLFSHVSGLEVYDAILFLTVLFTIIGSLIMYNIIASLNKHVAILSLPLTIYLFTIREARVAFYWGHWPALLGNFFLLSTVWVIINLNKKNAAFFLGLFLAGTALGHTSATIFALLFIILFFFVSKLFKKFTKKQFKTLLYGLIIFLIPTINFLIMFKQTWMVAHPQSFLNVVTDWSGGGGFIKLNNFGILTLILMLIGFHTLILKSFKEHFFQALLSIFALTAGLTNYIGFSMRAFNFRFYWPIMLSAFFGAGMYKILTLLTKEPKTLLTTITAVVIIILLLNSYYTPTKNIQGIMNPYNWQILNWLNENTAQENKIFFFYGDSYEQDASLGNTKRRNTRVEINDFVNTLKQKKISRNFPTKELMESGTKLPHKKNLFTYELYALETNDPARALRDLCSFDYYVFDTAGRFPALVKLNNIIRKNLLNHNFTKVFENQLSIVLKNPTPGGACFGTNNSITF